jgi:hypothetical protein
VARLSALEFLLALVVRRKGIIGANNRSNLECGSMTWNTLSETSSNQSSAYPRRKNAREVELDRGVGPLFDLFAGVDQVLHTSSVQVCDSGKVENNSAKKRLALFGLELGLGVAALGSGIIPRTFSQRNIGVIATTTGLGLDMLDNGRVDQRCVGVQEGFLTAVSANSFAHSQSVNDDTSGRGLHLDITVSDTTVTAEGHVDITGRSSLVVFRSDANAAEEVTTGTSQTEEQQDD